MILVPGGKKCYCGKAGCADAYCAASALTDEEQEMTLEQFMEKVEQKNTKTVEKWNQYLDNLAILISICEWRMTQISYLEEKSGGIYQSI